MEVIVDRCAGLDVHRDAVMACVRRWDDAGRKRVSEVREFRTWTSALRELRDWLAEAGVSQVAAVTFRVPDLDSGMAFYVDRLGHTLTWRNDDIGQAGLALPESDTEIVLTTEHGYEPNWLVESADEAARAIEEAGGAVLAAPFVIPVGRVAVVSDPFSKVLVLVDLSKGCYATDDGGSVTRVEPGA